MNWIEIFNKLQKKYNTALVTGGAGFIGSHICEQLVKNTSLKVISVDNYSAGKHENIDTLKTSGNFKSFNIDICDTKEIEAIVKGEKVDIIFNQAASKKNICLKDPLKDLDINGKAQIGLLEVARNYNVKKFVHASTGSVYGEAQIIPQTESHPLSPVSYYGISKLAGESYVNLFNKLYGLDTTILRYFHVYGPRQEFNEFGGVVAIFLRNLIYGETPVIFGDGTQERSFTYVLDVVKANFLSALTPMASGEAYNCASGINITINHLCELIISLFGKTGVVKPKYDDWLIGDIRKFSIDNTKIRLLGVDFDQNFDENLRTFFSECKKHIEKR